MKEIYEKLVENLANMTPEEKEIDWEELKKYNEIGPSVEEILKQNNMERPIGDKFDYEGVTLEVVQVENFSCKGCYFYNTNINCKPQNVRDCIGHCTESYREDKKIVIFNEVK